MSMSLTMRKLVLALVILTLSGTLLYAQTAPPPPNSGGSQPAGADVSAPDPDKKLVQDRWGASTGATSKKLTKKDKSPKTEPASSSGSPQ